MYFKLNVEKKTLRGNSKNLNHFNYLLAYINHINSESHIISQIKKENQHLFLFTFFVCNLRLCAKIA